MADNSGESFSSTSGLLAGPAPDDAPAQTPALSRLNPSRPRGFRALVRQAAGAEDAVQRSSSQVDSPRIRALDRSNASMSQASGSPLLGRLGEVTTSSFSEADGIEPQEQRPSKSRYGKFSNKPILCLLSIYTVLSLHQPCPTMPCSLVVHVYQKSLMHDSAAPSTVVYQEQCLICVLV